LAPRATATQSLQVVVGGVGRVTGRAGVVMGAERNEIGARWRTA
jgi:hypothetical protein